MSWTSLGDAVCDSCGDARIGNIDRDAAIQLIRAGGWHHATGTTIGGVPYEVILCKTCAHEERKRPRATANLQGQEQLPIDWEQWRINGSAGSGYTSR